MPEIRQLPQSVINKIAAGEVIERPASVVKELLENAVDAGAKRIEVSLGQGGSEYIRIADDGCGIRADQLLLAVASHATSKIRDADDLFHVGTLGFRGEALASISEVSRFLIRSRPAEADAGAQLEVVGGELGAIEPCGCGVGTTIEVRDLFFNTPVRRKFLRAASTEIGHATEAFTRVALAASDVHFVFRHNDRVIYDLPPTSSWRERIAAFFGREVGQSLIAMDGADGDLRMSGYVGDPQISRPNNRLQYLFLNGRCIRDRSLQHALGEAYRGLLLTGRFPIAFLRLEMPAELVDVNVHPTKLEVRFQDSGRIYAHLLGTVRRKFLASDLTARVASTNEPSRERAGDVTAEQATTTSSTNADQTPASFASHEEASPAVGAATPNLPGLDRWSAAGQRGEDAHDAREAARRRDELVAWARGRAAPAVAPTTSPGAPDWSHDSPVTTRSSTTEVPPWRWDPGHSSNHYDGGAAPSAPTSFAAPSFAATTESEADAPITTTPTAAFAPSDTAQSSAGSALRPGAGSAPKGVQLHDRYLVTEDGDGIVIIDQHALHERIIYEQLREKLAGGRFETQRLLVPHPVGLTGSEAAVLLDARETLAAVGIGLEPFGGGTVLVTSYPAMLAALGPTEIVRQVLERLLAGGKTVQRHDLVDEILHMMSCKAAVKFGDRLTPDEVEALLAQRHLYRDTHHCPHGRPTALVFSREELDKRFKRV